MRNVFHIQQNSFYEEVCGTFLIYSHILTNLRRPPNVVVSKISDTTPPFGFHQIFIPNTWFIKININISFVIILLFVVK
jgi:hypothetical protein